MSDYLTAVTTIDSAESAGRLARILVEERLAACVNVVPNVSSIYRWEGRVEEASEYLLLMKTRADRYGALAAALEAHHPYDVPELIAFPIASGSAGYFAWIDTSVQPEPEPEPGDMG